MAATKTIEIRTEIPGPRSRALAERELRAVAHPLLVHLPIFAERAENATITDVDGNMFVDFAGGVGVVNAGHAHPRVVEAIAEQAQRFVHTDFTVVPYETYVALAERLCALVPIARRDPRRVLQRRHRGGRERRQARAAPHRPARGDRVRGRLPRPHAALADDDLEVPPVQDRHGAVRARGLPRAVSERLSRAGRRRRRSPRLERMFETHVAPTHVAAIVFEPQQGEGGFVPAPREYVEGLRAICDRHGIVLVADEVQTGLRPHGADVRDGALRRRARPRRRREVDRGRASRSRA